jgi:hypothetical protein
MKSMRANARDVELNLRRAAASDFSFGAPGRPAISSDVRRIAHRWLNTSSTSPYGGETSRRFVPLKVSRRCSCCDENLWQGQREMRKPPFLVALRTPSNIPPHERKRARLEPGATGQIAKTARGIRRPRTRALFGKDGSDGRYRGARVASWWCPLSITAHSGIYRKPEMASRDRRRPKALAPDPPPASHDGRTEVVRATVYAGS